jgi:hypothetical protein
MSEENKLDYFILENIYLNVCRNIVKDDNLEYSSNYIYLSIIPDFIEYNEKFFVNNKSTEYQ